MHIPTWPQAGEREIELLREVLESPQWGGFHPFVDDFEKSFAAFQHAAFGIAAFNGTVTLEALLTVLGIAPGDEVIVPAISFISTAMAVARLGAVPVFVDIGEDSYNIDPQLVRSAITERTRLVLPVHFGGTMCDMQNLEAICRESHLLLVEDAAHAQGSEWDGKRAGSFGIASSFSFQNGKVLPSGEGGMLLTSDATLAGSLRSLINCGRVPGRSFYDHPNLGTNFRMTAFQAAVLIAQFERLPQQLAQRTANALFLKDKLGDCVRWQREPRQATANSYYLLVGRAGSEEARDRLCRSLQQAGVPCTPFYPHVLYQNEVFQKVPCRVHPCPAAEARTRDAFWLGHRALLAERETVEQIAALMRAALS